MKLLANNKDANLKDSLQPGLSPWETLPTTHDSERLTVLHFLESLHCHPRPAARRSCTVKHKIEEVSLSESHTFLPGNDPLGLQYSALWKHFLDSWKWRALARALVGWKVNALLSLWTSAAKLCSIHSQYVTCRQYCGSHACRVGRA